jgi:hypothetical protein
VFFYLSADPHYSLLNDPIGFSWHSAKITLALNLGSSPTNL